ncbi:MAG: SBBP repeat-containing protein [Pseudomonadales bacterium]|nr:SBBP repeat-containing protein [Pseudomonadales bacterium]
MAIDSNGNLFVAGRTLSTDIPTTANAYQPAKRPDWDLFVVKLDSDLSTVLASTYLGGNKMESWGPVSITVDSRDNVVLLSRTISPDFPVTSGAFDTSYNDYAPGHGDAVVAKLDNSLSDLMAATFIGGALWDDPRAISIDSQDNIIIGGATNNSSYYGAFYPVTPGAFASCSNHAFSAEAFVSRLSSDLSTLLASTCIGQNYAFDAVYAVAEAADASVVIAGRTESNHFPVTAGAFDTSSNGGHDAFVARFDATLSVLMYSSYLGGNANDFANGMLLDANGNIHIAGGTSSENFPVTPDGSGKIPGGSADAFHARFAPDLSALEFSTLIGGSGADWAYGPLLINSDIYLYGYTRSDDFPTSPGAYDSSYNGGYDGFIARPGLLVLDSDGDGVDDTVDNCPAVANPGQTDTDGDGPGRPLIHILRCRRRG